MGLSGAVIFNSAVDRIQQTAKNLQALQDARKRRQREDEIFKLNKQRAEIQLKEAELKGEGTAIQNQVQKQLMNEYFKQQDTINKGRDAQIDFTEHQQMQQGQEAKAVAKSVLQNDPVVQSMVAQRINPSLAVVPGPNGGMIQGQDESVDNTPEAVPSAFDNVPQTPLEPTIEKGKMALKKGKTGDLINKRIDTLKKSGVPLLPEEQYFDYRKSLADQGIKYNRNAVLVKARQMAIDQASADGVPVKNISQQQWIEQIPNAEEALYGKSMKSNSSDETQKEEKPSEPTNRDLGKIDNEKVKVRGKDGKLYSLPKNQLEEAKKQGYIQV